MILELKNVDHPLSVVVLMLCGVRLLLIGRSGMGKTSLLKALRDYS